MANFRETALDNIPPDFTLEKLQALLSQQEIEAMRADDPDMFADEPAAAAAPAPAAPAPAAVQLPPPPEAPPVQQAAPVQPPQIDIPDTTDAQAVVAAFDSKMEAVQSKYDDGEITAAEFRAHLSALAKEQAAAQARIDMAAQLEAQVQAQKTAAADAERQQFSDLIKAHAARPDKAVFYSDEHRAGWDIALRAVTGDPSLAHLTLAQCIERAEQSYRMNYTATTGKVLPGSPVPPQETAKTQLQVRTDERDPPPQTLAGLNGETMGDANASMFAAIDAMTDPIEAEKAVAALSPGAREMYFKSV